jgi:DNA helicase IV
MAIKCPPDRLSRSQLIVSNLPIDKNYVISGGPGTGKTLLALLRADRIRSTFLREQGRDPNLLFIVFNRPLQNYLKSNMSLVGLTEEEATTWHYWMWHQACPNYLGVDNPRDLQLAMYQYDWDRVMAQLRKHNLGDAKKLDHVILDEAQDLPEGLVSFLDEISENITIFMDDHQMIDEQDNERGVKEVKLTRNRALQIVADGDPYRLQLLLENHRNSQAIVDLANKFMQEGDIAPDAINKGGRKPEMIVYRDLDAFAQEVAAYAENNPDQNISVFLPSNEEKSSFVELLRAYRTVKNGVSEYKDVAQTPNFDPE